MKKEQIVYLEVISTQILLFLIEKVFFLFFF